MGQIVSTAAKPKRCNKNQLSQLGVLAAGLHVLVSSDNSMNAAGQGNFDCYIEGDGNKTATALELKPINPKEAQLYYEMYSYTEEYKYTTTGTQMDVPLAAIGGVVGKNILFSFSGSATLFMAITQRIGSTSGANQPIVSKGDGLYEVTWNNNQNPDCDTMRFFLSGDRTQPSNFVFFGDEIKGLKERFEDFSVATNAAIEAEAEAREASMDNLYDNVLPKAFITKEVTGTSFVLTDHAAGLPLVSLNQNAFIHDSNLLDVDLFNPYFARERTKSFILNGYGGHLVENENLLKILKPNSTYTLSFDFEVLQDPAGSASEYRVGFILSGTIYNTYNASQFKAGLNGHISHIITTGSSITAVMSFFTGGGTSSSENVDVRFTNVRLVEGSVELPWEEADNIDFVVGDAMPVLSSPKEWIEASANATIVYQTSNEILVNKVEKLEEYALEKRNVSGTFIVLRDHIVGMPLVSLNKDAFIHNTNLFSADMCQPVFGVTTTRSFTLNGNAKILAPNANIRKIYKTKQWYYVSFDYEIKAVNGSVASNKVGINLAFENLTAEQFVVGHTGHLGNYFNFPTEAYLDQAQIVFYTGAYGTTADIEFKNFRIVNGGKEKPWEEADNIFFEVGDEMPVLNCSTEIIETDAYADVEYYVKDDIGITFIANPFIVNCCHRGYSQLAPEDTAPAYVYAKKMGFLCAENDLWFTSDGVPVMVHARDLSLVTNGTGNIDEVTYDYFKSLDFGQGENYNNKYVGLKGLNFDEWIGLMKQLGMTPWIDTKKLTPAAEGVDNIVLLKSILDKHGMTDIVIWSVGWSGASAIREVMPKATVGITFSNETPTDEDIARAAEFIIDGDRHSIYISPDVYYLTQEVVDKCHMAGISCLAWISDVSVIDRPEDVVQWVKTGIDGFMSDGANVTKIIENYYYDLYGVR